MILVGDSEVRRPSRRSNRRGQDKQVGCEGEHWIKLAANKDQRLPFFHAAIKTSGL